MATNQWTRVVVPSSTIYRFPEICPGCLKQGAKSQVLLRSEKGRLQAFYLFAAKWQYLCIAVPFCADCAKQLKRWANMDALLLVIAATGALSIAGLIASSLVATVWVFWGVFFCAAVILTLLLDSFVSDYRAVRIKWYDANNVTFLFKHSDYAREFERLNLQGRPQ